VEQLYQRHRLPRPYAAQLNDLLEYHVFTAATPNVIQLKLHALRKAGNKGAHGSAVTSETILARLDDALNVARWFYLTLLGGKRDQTPQVLVIAILETFDPSKVQSA
jgi:type I restriction enzyme R subunit